MDLWNIYVLICHRNVSAECRAPLCDNPSSGSADQVCVLYMNVNSTWKDWHILTVYHTKKYWCTECQSQSHAIVTWTNMSIVNVFRKNWLYHIGTILYLLKKKTVYLMKMMASCRARFINKRPVGLYSPLTAGIMTDFVIMIIILSSINKSVSQSLIIHDFIINYDKSLSMTLIIIHQSWSIIITKSSVMFLIIINQ